MDELQEIILEVVGWDITKSAGFYSAMSAVLAGFVFTAIGILLSNPPGGKAGVRKISMTLNWLVTTFVTLMIAAFLFGLLAGEDRYTGDHVLRIRPFVEETICETLFSIGMIELMLSIVWFFREYSVARTVLRNTSILFYGVVLISAELIISAFVDWRSAASHVDWTTDPKYLFVLLLLALLPALLGTAIRQLWKDHFQRLTQVPGGGPIFPVLLSNTVAVIGACVCGFVSGIDETSLHSLSSDSVFLPTAICLAVLFAVYIVYLPIIQDTQGEKDTGEPKSASASS